MPSRSRRSVVVLGALAALGTLAAPVAAHVTASPPWLRVEERSTLTLEVPNERTAEMVAVEVTAPSGIELADASAPPGWDADVRGATATWQGRLPPRASVAVRLEARGRGAPGPLALTATQRFADGRAVRWSVPLTVLPARTSGGSSPWPEVAAALAAAAVLSLGVLAIIVRSRRAPLQDR